MTKNWTGILIGSAILAQGLSGCQFPSRLPFSPNLPLPTASVSTNPTLADPSSLAVLEQAIYQRVNDYRRSRHLPPLKLNARISQEARIHSERMAAKRVPFSHEGFENRAKSIGAVIPAVRAAENLAVSKGYSNPTEVVVQGWIESPKHRQAMEGQFDLTGIGIAQNGAGEYYFTQIFLQQRPPAASLAPLQNSQVTDSAFLTTLEQEIHRQVNQYRLSRQLPPLRFDARISDEARLHSQDMAQGVVPFSHDGFESRVKAIGATIPYRQAGENLAVVKGYPDLVAAAVRGWIDSPGHRKNMEGNFNLSGVGVAKNLKGEYYFTQIFVQER